MDRLAETDWNLIRSFLAVAEEGSLSAAARRLIVSQPTLGRHIQELEQNLNATLFNRHARGLKLTDAGAALMGPARDMADAAGRLALEAAGQAESETGTVRISTSVMFASYHMPEILADIRLIAPNIEIELHATDSSDNLLFREADIAVRMYRPEQLDLIIKKIGVVEIGMFAATDYIARRGIPATTSDLLEHEIIGYDRSEAILRGLRALGLQIDRSFFKIRCDDQVAHWKLIAAGCGIGFGQKILGREAPDLHAVLPDLPIPPFPVWLTMPMALQHTPRVRKVFDLLTEKLQARIA